MVEEIQPLDDQGQEQHGPPPGPEAAWQVQCVRQEEDQVDVMNRYQLALCNILTFFMGFQIMEECRFRVLHGWRQY